MNLPDFLAVTRTALPHVRVPPTHRHPAPFEDRRPLFEGFVGGDDDATAFVSLADDLEKQILKSRNRI